MSLPGSINPQIRDITFSFPNSCNSKCCNPKPETPKQYYINTGGNVETFKQRKARQDASKSFERSLAHLNQTLDRKVISFKGNPEEFQSRSEHIIHAIYNDQEINTSHLDAINRLMLDYVAERSPNLDIKEVEPATEKCVIL